jgi:hypothetical protein
MPTKIHELVAVEKARKQAYAAIVSETMNTFTKKEHLFQTHTKTYTALREGDTDKPSDNETPQPITTVKEKLNYFQKYLSGIVDIVMQKEDANSRSKADIILFDDDAEEITIAVAVPVTALVQIENLLDQVRKEVYDNIPTLDPAKKWFVNDSVGDGSYYSEDTVRQSTKKIPRVVTLHPGTDKHPPQVQLVSEDIVSGNWVTVHFSGKILPVEKCNILGRIDNLIDAVKKARARANSTEVDLGKKIGKTLIEYINNGVI